MILVDSNVLLDVFTEDPDWFPWSSAALVEAAETSQLAINPVIYAEVSARFSLKEELDEALGTDFVRADIPYEAAFLAGKLFVEHRRAGGSRTRPLPDFFIGAHAAVAGMHLLTRNPGDYRTRLPKLKLIAPE